MLVASHYLQEINKWATLASKDVWDAEAHHACLVLANTLSNLVYRYEAIQDLDIEAFFRLILAKCMPSIEDFWRNKAPKAQVVEAMTLRYAAISCVGREDKLVWALAEAKVMCKALCDASATYVEEQKVERPRIVDASREKIARDNRAGFVVHNGGRT